MEPSVHLPNKVNEAEVQSCIPDSPPEKFSEKRSLSSSSSSSDKAKAQLRPAQRMYHTHRKLKESKLSNLDVEKVTDVWKAVGEIPWTFAHPCPAGICLQRKTFLGLKRSGKEYATNWLRENHAELSFHAWIIIDALVYNNEFVTWDMLFAYLQNHNWGVGLQGLQPDLSFYPTKTEADVKHEEKTKSEELFKQLHDKVKEHYKLQDSDFLAVRETRFFCHGPAVAFETTKEVYTCCQKCGQFHILGKDDLT